MSCSLSVQWSLLRFGLDLLRRRGGDAAVRLRLVVCDGRPGLVVRTPDAVQAGAYMGVFPLAFTSSVFVPVQTMPGWLQAFAANQPVTVATNALRGLILGQGACRPGGPSPAGCCWPWPGRLRSSRCSLQWRCACTAARAVDPTIPKS
jgi:hypothetical protein